MRTNNEGTSADFGPGGIDGARRRPRERTGMKLWRHGIVEAKSDAGIVFMGSKGGFAEKQGLKIEIQAIQGRYFGAEVAACGGAGQLRRQSGLADDCGLAGRRYQARRLLLAGFDLRHLFQGGHQQPRRTQGQDVRHLGAWCAA